MREKGKHAKKVEKQESVPGRTNYTKLSIRDGGTDRGRRGSLPVLFTSFCQVTFSFFLVEPSQTDRCECCKALKISALSSQRALLHLPVCLILGMYIAMH